MNEALWLNRPHIDAIREIERLTTEGNDTALAVRTVCAQRDQLRVGLERVYHYWQERYHHDFSLADEPLMDEIIRVQDLLIQTEPK